MWNKKLNFLLNKYIILLNSKVSAEKMGNINIKKYKIKLLEKNIKTANIKNLYSFRLFFVYPLYFLPVYL